MTTSQFALFASGLFFGGAIDHAILAAQGRQNTPYGVRVGVSGNWMMAAGDLLVAAMLYRMHATADWNARKDSNLRFPT